MLIVQGIAAQNGAGDEGRGGRSSKLEDRLARHRVAVFRRDRDVTPR